MNKGMNSRENREALYENGDRQRQKKEWPLWSLFVVVIKGVHQVEKVFTVLITDRCGRFLFVIIIKEHWEHILHCLALRVAHGEHGGVGAFSHYLQFQFVAVPVAPDDAPCLPEADVVKKLTTRDAYFAHEQLVGFVGAG